MSQPLKCPQCGASEANLLQDNIYQCKFCGSIYEYGDGKSVFDDVKPVFEETVRKEKPVSFDEEKTQAAAQKISKLIFIAVALVFAGVGASIFFSIRKSTSTNTISSYSSTAKKLYKDNNETNSCFTVVNTDKGPQVWTVSRRNSDGLKEVSYFLNQIDVKENTIIMTTPIGATITWEQSLKDEYRMNQLQPMGKVCWLIFGEKLIGYDMNDGTEIANNETLKRTFPELKNGIAKIENVYDMEGFKLTTKDGFIYYYAAIQDKLFTEKQYDEKYKNTGDFTNKTEYIFTDEERQQLYKINRKAGTIFDYRISSNTLNDIVKEKDGWYKKTYKINSVEEFTPNEIYFKAAVLYADDSKIVLIYKKELGESSPIIIKCVDTNKKEIWTKTGEETEIFKPFLKSTNSENFLNGNQLTVIQPYQIAVCMNIENGNINWSFKPY